ncbi:hypothetical protein [Paraburkholderia sp. BCC1876]|uniref:hypothetical protein n=1 Tax=Paraburkholderia sp. BCC1876 TaxID=2676303 RepID=UPI001FC89184|nr:hypothetical protein [Paraburkholderia sp. BCC1876]
MIPFYPVYRAFKSVKDTAGSGVKTLHDLTQELDRQKPTTRHVRSYREALARRPSDALPLKRIAQDCLNKKRMCLAFVTLCGLYVIWGVFGGDIFAVVNGILGIGLPMLFAVKYEWQLWQLETGPQQPDAPLGSLRDFFRSRDAVLRLFNPRF